MNTNSIKLLKAIKAIYTNTFLAIPNPNPSPKVRVGVNPRKNDKS